MHLYVKFVLHGGDVLVTNFIREYREELGLTQQELADRVNVSRQTIISLEKGSYNPSLELSLKISRVLKRSIEILFILEDEK